MNAKIEQNEKIKSSNLGYKIERKIEVKKIKNKVRNSSEHIMILTMFLFTSTRNTGSCKNR